jgi:hypothetical protein
VALTRRYALSGMRGHSKVDEEKCLLADLRRLSGKDPSAVSACMFAPKMVPQPCSLAA